MEENPLTSTRLSGTTTSSESEEETHYGHLTFPTKDGYGPRCFLRRILGDNVCAKMAAFWALSILSTAAVVGFLFLILFVAVPKTLLSSSSQSYISNNPLRTESADDGVEQWLNDYSHSALPVNCHSHNDYLRPRPVFSALVAGCVGIEADVWLSDDGDLLVGHSDGVLSADKTLKTLYIDPLLRVLDALNQPSKVKLHNSTSKDSNADNNSDRTPRNGMFRTDPDAATILFIDVKSDPAATWPVVLEQLEPLRKRRFLSWYDGKSTASDPTTPFVSGPITVVATGNMIPERAIMKGPDVQAWKEYHDTFIDAPLDLIPEPDPLSETELGWGRDEFYTASASLVHSIGPVKSTLTNHQLTKLRSQISAAAERNLTSRYWAIPQWPVSHRDFIWEVLVQQGIGLLNADDVQSAAKMKWRNWAYIIEVVWLCVTSVYLCGGLTGVGWLCYRIAQRQGR